MLKGLNKIAKISAVQSMLLLSLVAIIIAAFVNSLFRFDGIDFNGDSYVYFQMAQRFHHAMADFMLPSREHWPFGYPALLSISFFLKGEFFSAAQWINIIAGGVLIAICGGMTLLIARLKNLNSQTTSLFVLVTMLMLIGRGTIMKYQLLIMSDMMGIVWATLMMLGLWRWKISKSLVPLIIGGVAFGLALSTRHVYVLMIVPLTIILLSEFSLKKIFPAAVLFCIGFLIGVLPQLMIMLKGTLSSTDYGLLHDWSLKNVFTLSFESLDGHQTSRIPNMLYYFILPFRFEDFTPVGLLFVCLGFYYAVCELPRWILLSLAFWYLTFYILLCGIPIQNPRIAFSLYVPLAIFAALGILWCLQRFQIKWVLSGVMLLTVISIVFSVRYIDKLVQTKNELSKVAEEVAVIAEKNSRIISTSLYAVYLAYPMDVEPKSIYNLSIPEVEAILADTKKTLLAIDETKFIPQWGNYPAGKTYWWIRNHYRCNLIAHSGEYSVYQVMR
jgi:hypothetical protein